MSASVGPMPHQRAPFRGRYQPVQCPRCGDTSGACRIDHFFEPASLFCLACGLRKTVEPEPSPQPEPGATPNGHARAEAPKAESKAQGKAHTRDKAQTKAEAKAEQEQPQPVTMEITLLTKRGGPLTKRIALDADGKLKNDSSACLMTQGTARRVVLAGDQALVELIGSMPAEQAIALGRLRPGLPDQVEIVTKRAMAAYGANIPPNTITRTADNLLYQEGPGWVLIDFDSKGMPDVIRARIDDAGDDPWHAFVEVEAELARVLGMLAVLWLDPHERHFGQ